MQMIRSTTSCTVSSTVRHIWQSGLSQRQPHLVQHWARSRPHRFANVGTASALSRRFKTWNSQGEGGAPDPESLTYDAALGRALRLVNYRDRTAHELQQKLLEDGYTAEIAQEAVGHVQRAGLQSDERYAELYARGQWRRTLRAPVRIRMELRAKGVATPVIEAALHKVFGSSRSIQPCDLSALSAEEGVGGDADCAANDYEDEEEEEDEDDVCQRDAWALILQEARKRAAMSAGEAPQKRKAKLARWLQARGHTWDTVSRVVAALKL